MINIFVIVLILLVVFYIAVGIGSSIARFMIKKKLLPGFEDLPEFV